MAPRWATAGADNGRGSVDQTSTSLPCPTAMDHDLPLVERTLAGELSAYEVLVERHRDTVFRVAARIVGRDEAEDVTQDAFLRAFHRLPRFRREAPFRNWLLRIAHNTALNSLARRRAAPVAISSGEEDAEQSEALLEEEPGRGPAAALEAAERRQRLQIKLGLLRPEHRSVLVLRDLEGLSYNEVADVLDVPLGSVKGRLSRARLELIDLLRRNTYDWELPE